MILTRLQLQHFRNYRKLDIELQPGVTLLHGPNGAGKTNIVEAIFTLATTKSFRARFDRELIDRGFEPDDAPFAFARLQGDAVDSEDQSTRVEVLISAVEKGDSSAAGSRKQFRLNGVPKRASDVVGQIKAVLFSPADVDLVAGSPAARRRFVDLMLCQVDPGYLRLLQSYSRVVQQRNAVLTRLAGSSQAALLEIWDEKLIDEGSRIVMRRHSMMSGLAGVARDFYARLSACDEELRIEYQPAVGAEAESMDGDVGAIATRLRAALESESRRRSDQRVTPVGPHRDDLLLTIDGEPLLAYGSRGQQRTAAEALRMAEASYITSETGRQPIMLLDEALGELDDSRRDALLSFVTSYPQVILTGAVPAAFPASFRATARLVHIQDGAVVEGSGA